MPSYALERVPLDTHSSLVSFKKGIAPEQKRVSLTLLSSHPPLLPPYSLNMSMMGAPEKMETSIATDTLKLSEPLVAGTASIVTTNTTDIVVPIQQSPIAQSFRRMIGGLSSCSVCHEVIAPEGRVYCPMGHAICEFCADEALYHVVEASHSEVLAKDLNCPCPECRAQIWLQDRNKNGSSAVMNRIHSQWMNAHIVFAKDNAIEAPRFGCGFAECKAELSISTLQAHRLCCIHRPMHYAHEKSHVPVTIANQVSQLCDIGYGRIYVVAGHCIPILTSVLARYGGGCAGEVKMGHLMVQLIVNSEIDTLGSSVLPLASKLTRSMRADGMPKNVTIRLSISAFVYDTNTGLCTQDYAVSLRVRQASPMAEGGVSIFSEHNELVAPQAIPCMFWKHLASAAESIATLKIYPITVIRLSNPVNEPTIAGWGAALNNHKLLPKIFEDARSEIEFTIVGLERVDKAKEMFARYTPPKAVPQKQQEDAEAPSTTPQQVTPDNDNRRKRYLESNLADASPAERAHRIAKRRRLDRVRGTLPGFNADAGNDDSDEVDEEDEDDATPTPTEPMVVLRGGYVTNAFHAGSDDDTTDGPTLRSIPSSTFPAPMVRIGNTQTRELTTPASYVIVSQRMARDRAAREAREAAARLATNNNNNDDEDEIFDRILNQRPTPTRNDDVDF